VTLVETVDRLFYDALETREPAARERALVAALPAQIALAKAEAPYYARMLAGIDPQAVNGRAALAALPVTRKSDLKALQAATPPFGGLAGVGLGAVAHLYQSPGPIYEPDGPGPDYWRFARALWAAGARPGGIVHNSFSYHLTPAGMMIEGAARALGCPVFPGGTGNTEQQVQAIAALRPSTYAGTPSFLKILLERAAETQSDASSLKHASVGGEALPPSLRRELAQLGVAALQNYGTADLGLIAYETPAMDGLVIDEGVLFEIVAPGSGDPVAEGEIGEVLVTVFNQVYPLIRFATGDLSAILPGPSPCGRTNMRIRGWLGRADQVTKVRGMFVHPEQVRQVMTRHVEIGRARLVVESHDNRDEMTLHCEATTQDPALAAKIADTLQAVCKVRGHVVLARPGELADDGKLIADMRSYA